jgi:hypothetical protein
MDVFGWQSFLRAQKLLGKRSSLSMLVFDAIAQTKTREFQRMNGVPETGTLDAPTMQAAVKKGFSPHQNSASGFAPDEQLLFIEATDAVARRYASARTEVFGTDTDYKGKKVPSAEVALYCIIAGRKDAPRSGMIAALWAKESNFDQLPDGDAGPAQLTGWWLRNHPDLVRGDAYGSWHGRSKVNFDGNALDNVLTLGNVVRFLDEHNRSLRTVPSGYGPPENREAYQSEVETLWKKYVPFFSKVIGAPTPEHK